MELVDTHCHIHEAVYAAKGENETQARWMRDGKPDIEAILQAAAHADVTRMICVGCSVEDSDLAVEFVQKHPETWASIGIHPHEANRYIANKKALEHFAMLAGKPKVIAVGECGLDYFYAHSPKVDQEKILHFQLKLAEDHDLPVIFHVREAFDDFWPIFDQYKVRGVIHSFSSDRRDLDEILKRGLYVGLNGIMTFTKQPEQLTAAKAVPLDKLLLETDAPYLTPTPYRGTICEPSHVRVTGEFLAGLRDESLEKLAQATTRNARHLFGLT